MRGFPRTPPVRAGEQQRVFTEHTPPYSNIGLVGSAFCKNCEALVDPTKKAEMMTPQDAEYSILRKINSTGRNVIVQCVDDELYENEVLLLLILHHQFDQLHIDLEEGCVLLLPDFTADKFLKLKIELLSSEKTVKDLFFPKNKQPVEKEIITDNEVKTNASVVNLSQKETCKIKSESTKDDRAEQNYIMDHLEVEGSDKEDRPGSAVVESKNFDESLPCVKEENEDDDQQSEMAFYCDQCDFTSKRKNHLRSHKLIKHEGVRYDCDRCEFRATTRSILRQHIQSIHEGIRYQCDLCTFSSTKKREVRVHKESIHDIKPEKDAQRSSYECDLCESVFKNKSSLTDHLNYKHVGIKYPCDKCDFKAARKSNLRAHNLSKHSNEKLLCDECSFQTSLPKQLKLHKLTSHGGVRYYCDQCDYNSVLESRLRAHKQSIHEGTKVPAVCDECGAKQSDLFTLRRHIKQMHGGKPYECDICEFRTGYKEYLKKHKESQHNQPELQLEHLGDHFMIP